MHRSFSSQRRPTDANIVQQHWLTFTFTYEQPNQNNARYLVNQTFSKSKWSKCLLSLETRRESLFYLFFRVYADLCTVKTMNFWCNEGVIVQKHCLAEALNRTIEILISKISKDLHKVKPTQHKVVVHYKRFEVRRVSRLCLHWLWLRLTLHVSTYLSYANVPYFHILIRKMTLNTEFSIYKRIGKFWTSIFAHFAKLPLIKNSGVKKSTVLLSKIDLTYNNKYNIFIEKASFD